MKRVILCAVLMSGFSVSAQQVTVSVVDVSGKAIVGAVVEMVAPQLNAYSPIPKTYVVSQYDKAFTPYILAVPQGADVVFKNEDSISHHLYSLSDVAAFSFRLKAGERKEDIEFEQAGAVSMGCNIHDWMSGYIRVVTSPVFAQTDKNGEVTLAVPDGVDQADITAWHPQLQESLTVSWATEPAVRLQATMEMLPIPTQESSSDIYFERAMRAGGY
ncbi:hypothetical protein [Thaumasiovibrio subtropicus]|uniref:hypothetical protein n=1 Tax=Thaumasiovibrio subtropicus TaxID=1891207 RepID=UPI00131C8BD2|nr:hypothetical protein [Thaumasiovibrio subtropicus]